VLVTTEQIVYLHKETKEREQK